jgi:aminobenzoyl-glutamate utilization protein B
MIPAPHRVPGLLIALVFCSAALAADARPIKQTAVAHVESHSKELISLSDQIWAFAETALKETRSSKALADYAAAQGFAVQRGVAGLPTAFVASYGEGHPIVGILGEYDALPAISQKAQAVKEALVEGAAGHGCGHNMFGAASLGAAIAIKELIASGKLHGTIRIYGTPAEEAVGGKIYMARAGLFSDLDVVLAWHPADKTQADATSSQALVDFIVEFKGRAAHAAADPWNGRSAADGLELFTHGLNMMREHVKPTVRMHYVIQKAGDVPNVVPEYARLWCWVRDKSRSGVEDVLKRVRPIAEGAALMAGVESKITIQGGDWELLVNLPGERLLEANMKWLGELQFTAEEQAFAKKIQKAVDVPEAGLVSKMRPIAEQEFEGGSTDVGDISWIVPTLHLSVTTAPYQAPWHAWPVVACGGMSIGHKGMVYASKTLAATMVDLFTDPKTLSAIQDEFKKQTAGVIYVPYIPKGPPPAPAP